MDKSIRQQGSDTQQPNDFSASLQILDSVINWLDGLFTLTEEEQKKAGIDFGDQRDE